MADATMCVATCPLAQTCQRHLSSGRKPSKHQSWAEFRFTVEQGDGVQCDHYILAALCIKRTKRATPDGDGVRC